MQNNKQLRIFGSIWLFILVITAFLSRGWLQPDEHARVLEPAHQLAYGFSTLPWELTTERPIVSWFLGAVMSPILLISRLLNISGISAAFLARLFVGLIASTRLIALYKIFEVLDFRKDRRILYLSICAFAVYGPFIFVRTSQENFGCTALLWAFLLHLNITSNSEIKQRWIVAFGSLLALAVSARLQLGPSAALLGLYTLFKTGKRIVPSAALGLFLGLLPMAIADTFATGLPFIPAINYFHYAITGEEGGHVWGTNPWWYYFQQFFEAWYPPLTIFLVPLLFYGLWKSPPLFLVSASFIAVHFMIAHKETRYFTPMIPFFQIASIYGWEKLEESKHFYFKFLNSWKKTGRFFFYAFCLFGLCGGLIELNTSPSMYTVLGDLERSKTIESYTYVGNTRTPASKFFTKVTDKEITRDQVSWDDVRDGTVKPSGWLAFYSIGPVSYHEIQKQCRIEYVSVSDLEMSILMFMPKKTPIRRRINTIAFCEKTPIFPPEN